MTMNKKWLPLRRKTNKQKKCVPPPNLFFSYPLYYHPKCRHYWWSGCQILNHSLNYYSVLQQVCSRQGKQQVCSRQGNTFFIIAYCFLTVLYSKCDCFVESLKKSTDHLCAINSGNCRSLQAGWFSIQENLSI